MWQIIGATSVDVFDDFRNKFGKRFEHEERTGPARGIWVYLPDWLPAWADAVRRQSSASDSEHSTGSNGFDARWKKARAETIELDLEKSRGNLIPAREVDRDFDLIGLKIREGIETIQTINPDAAQIMIDKLDEIERVFNADEDEEDDDRKAATSTGSKVRRKRATGDPARDA